MWTIIIPVYDLVTEDIVCHKTSDKIEFMDRQPRNIRMQLPGDLSFIFDPLDCLEEKGVYDLSDYKLIDRKISILANVIAKFKNQLLGRALSLNDGSGLHLDKFNEKIT